jgi:NTP pyrophosphatase (non-canonical NTP hydrolase)
LNVNLEELAFSIHSNAVDKGFWSKQYGEAQTNQILAKMMLIDTEVSELADAYVKQRGSEEIKKEAADIIIRLLDLLAAMHQYGIIKGIITETLIEKIEFNKSRPAKHNRLM